MAAACSTRIAAAVALLCTGWSLAYVLCSATPSGHSWYGVFAKQWFNDYKGGIPILTLALPLLIMSSICTLLVVSQSSPMTSAAKSYRYQPRLFGAAVLSLPCTLLQHLRRSLSRISFDALSFVFILLPCLVFFASDIYRHLHGNDLSTDKRIMEVANAGGSMAMIALSFFLIPVTRHSILLSLMGWGPEKAVRMHIWSGRTAIIGIVYHGLGHMYRWYLTGENVVGMLIPEKHCWELHHDDDDTDDHDGDRKLHDDDGECYNLFRNFTGFVAMLFFLAIAFSSLHFVRRANYRIFYTLHVIAGPVALLFTILHWNRMLLFICPSILYYAASTVPVLVRLFRSYMHENGIKVISATDLSCANSTDSGVTRRGCACLTFEVDDEAIRQFIPGGYVKLSVPSISRISHPFTVNRVMNSKRRNQMQIIFRATGPFTVALANTILVGRDAQRDSSQHERVNMVPAMLMDGFYGQSDLARKVLGHDVAVIVAGGVGITPYLSLISELLSEPRSPDTFSQEHLGDISEEKRQIRLHWICRDPLLIDYVAKHYFTPSKFQGSAEGCSLSLEIIVHQTSGRNGMDDLEMATPTRDYSGANDKSHHSSCMLFDSRTFALGSGGIPFSPSRFSTKANHMSILGNLPNFLTFSITSWVGLVVIWYLYDNFVSKTEIISRSYGILAIIPISLVFGISANIILDSLDAGNALNKWTLGYKQLSRNGVGDKHERGLSEQYVRDSFTEEHEEAGLSLQDLSTCNRKDEKETNDITNESPSQSNTGGLEGGRDSAFRIENSSGRPSFLSILSILDSALHPGIFVCGPSSMVKDVKYAARTQHSVRLDQCLSVATPEIYEETFEL